MVSAHLYRRVSDHASDRRRRHRATKRLGLHAGVSVSDSRAEFSHRHRVQVSCPDRCDDFRFRICTHGIPTFDFENYGEAGSLGDCSDFVLDGCANFAGWLRRIARPIFDQLSAVSFCNSSRRACGSCARNSLGDAAGAFGICADVCAAFCLRLLPRTKARREV